MGVCEMPSSNGRMAVGPSSELTRRWYRPRSSSGISTRRCLVWQGVVHLASADMKARIHDRFPHRGYESNSLLASESLLAGGHLPLRKGLRLSSPSPNPKACRLYSSLLNTRPRQQNVVSRSILQLESSFDLISKQDSPRFLTTAYAGPVHRKPSISCRA